MGNSFDTTTATGGSASGAYAAQQDVQDLIGTDNLDVVGDLDADGNLDAGIVQRALDFADAYVNLELSRNGLTVPADLSDATRATVLRDIAAHLAVWHLWHHRGIKEGRGASEGIGGIFEGYKSYADAQLAKLTEWLEEAGGTGTEIIPAVQAVVPASERCGNGWW